jgi:hypothetical protein
VPVDAAGSYGRRMTTHWIDRAAHITLLVAQAFIAVTAIAGGLDLVVGTAINDRSGVLIPSTRFLAGSPFSSYLVPGLLLLVVIGGLHVAAWLLALRRSRFALLASAVAGFATLIWVFVELAVIPFSPLQVLYEALGLVELGAVLVGLGLLAPLLQPAGGLPAGALREERA